MIEVGDGLSRPENRQRFTQLLRVLQAQSDVEIIPVDHDWFRQGCELHAQRPDKAWSLTDCISFAVMKARGIEHALTSDHHFEQAGFQALIK